MVLVKEKFYFDSNLEFLVDCTTDSLLSYIEKKKNQNILIVSIIDMQLISVKEHDMHIEPKYCKLKPLGKLVV